LSESARSEIEELLDQQLDEEYGLELTDENGNVIRARKRLGQ
jgi:hypothetical protein